jgi:hypothetical protein
MERPKQQAIAFLLGAVLVGGALGFSAERVFRNDDLTPDQQARIEVRRKDEAARHAADRKRLTSLCQK